MRDESAPQFAAALSRFLASHSDIGCVFPVGERDISFLTQHRALLPGDVAYAMPGESVVKTCLDKIATLDLLRELDIPHAAYQIAANRDGMTNAINALGFPCVVKPRTEQTKLFGLKALVLRTPSEFEAALRDWPEGAAEFIVQRYFEGQRHNVYFFAEDGRVRSRVEVRIGRTDRVDGTGYAVEGDSVPLTPCLGDYTTRLVHRLNYHGAGCAQYLVDAKSDETTFLEINARLGANFAAAYDCGLDLPRWWVEAALGKKPEMGVSQGKAGRHYCWLTGDLQGFKNAVLNRESPARELLRWPWRTLRAWAAADVHVTWDWRDPVPTLRIAGGMVLAPLRQLGAALSRLVGRFWSFKDRAVETTESRVVAAKGAPKPRPGA